MKKILLLLSLMILNSCSPMKESLPEETEMSIYNEWLYAFNVKNLKVGPEVILRPPGIEQLLFSMQLPTEGGAAFKTHCVYYQVPYKKIEGKFVIDELKNDVDCPDTSKGSHLIELHGLSDLMVKLENFKLNLNFKKNGHNYNWTFLLPNISGGLSHQKYLPTTEKKLYPGMMILPINEETFDPINNKYLGKIGDRMARGSAIRCLQINKACQQVGEDRCDDCRYGWYQVVDNNCEQSSRFCGQNHCGEKNEPACVRGTKIVDLDEAGICQSDLTPIKNADNILVCQ